MAKDAYIVDVVRTPRGRGKSNGTLHEVKPIDLLRIVLQALQQRQDFDTKEIEDIIIGCVTPIGEQGGNLGKAVALYSDCSYTVPGMQLNRFCASALDSINIAAARIKAGFEDLIIAGGVESMSRVPMGTDGGVLMYDPAVSGAINYVPQGISADLIATIEQYSRAMLDEYALRSNERALYAQQQGYFKNSIIPVCDLNGLTILDKDETIRATTTMEQLEKLPSSFAAMGKMGFDMMAILRYPVLERIFHLHTAGNSCQLSDGAALALIASKEKCKELGLKPRAKIIGAAVCADEPTIMLTATIPATEKALKKAGLKPSEIDLWEVNEAFAASTLKFQQYFGIDSNRLNINGGAISLGHPLGATGAMLIASLIDELERTGQKTGLATLCTGGGMGVATIVQLV